MTTSSLSLSFRVLFARAALMAAVSFAAVTAHSETINFFVYSPVTSSTTVRGQTAMISEIEKATNGQVQVKMHLGGSLPINLSNVTSAVADNVVQMADDIFQTGTIPLVEGLRLPRLFHSYQEAETALKIMDPYIRAAYDKQGVTLLGGYIYPEQVLWSRSPLTSLASLKNKKIRVTSPSQIAFIKMFGGVPVTLATSEVAPALERSIVDGILTASSGAAFIFKDLLKYNYRLNTGYAQSYIVINKETFQKLSPSTQGIIRNAVSKAVKAIDESLTADDLAMTEKLKAGGITVVAASKEDEAEADKQSRRLWEEWGERNGPEAADMLKKIRAAVGR